MSFDLVLSFFMLFLMRIFHAPKFCQFCRAIDSIEYVQMICIYSNRSIATCNHVRSLIAQGMAPDKALVEVLIE